MNDDIFLIGESGGYVELVRKNDLKCLKCLKLEVDKFGSFLIEKFQ